MDNSIAYDFLILKEKKKKVCNFGYDFSN